MRNMFLRIFIIGFDHFLPTIENNQHNAAAK
jgi:hypothetical protein